MASDDDERKKAATMIHGGGQRRHESICCNGCEATMNFPSSNKKLLVVGNYCHDTINPPGGCRSDTLGGSAAYVSNVLCSLGIPCDVVAKVGRDFAYGSRVSVAPAVAATSPTTHFVAEYSGGQDRLLRADRLCEAIYPADLVGRQCSYFDLGLAVGVAGEILPETLEKIVQLCGQVVVDVQALIRVIDRETGEVNCCKLEDSPFNDLLHRVSFIKAAQSEAEFMDVESLRKRTCVIVTKGAQGCSIYLKNKEYHVPTFPTEEVDPTGAGDSFLGGFAAGLHAGLSTEKAALLGNYFGALAVAQIGIPSLSQPQIEEAKKVLLGLE